MLGNEFLDILSERSGFDVTEFDRDELDVRRREDVLNTIHRYTPDVVINATGYTDVDGAETNVEEAYALNAYAPKYIAEGSRDENAILVHFSTDFVFDGEKEAGYTEEDTPENPINTYGASKRRGEEYVMETNPYYYLVRISWLFGKHGKNFVYGIRQKALSGEEQLRVVTDQMGKPTYTKDLVKEVLHMLQEKAEYGIYHLTNGTPEETGISKYDLAQTTVNMLGSPVTVVPATSDMFPTKAPRPHYSALRNTRREPLRGYEQAVHEYTIEEEW